MKKSLIILLLISLTSMAQAIETVKIGWNDLQGKVNLYDNPFDRLTPDQLENVSVYARIKQIEEFFPYKLTEEMQNKAADAKANLIAEEIDIDYLLEQRLLLIEKRQQAAKETNNLLADRNIEMTGFMLPLEFNNGLVTEFLLVPTLGACSHKAVPPANQIILVSAKKAIEAGSPYMPVKVTGTLRITQQNKDLYLVDGTKSIERHIA